MRRYRKLNPEPAFEKQDIKQQGLLQNVMKEQDGKPIGAGKIPLTEDKGRALELVAKKFGKSRKTLETYRAKEKALINCKTTYYFTWKQKRKQE